MSDATLEISILRRPDGLRADALLARAASDGDPAELARDVPLALDAAALAALQLDPAAYGRALSAALFADERLRLAWLQAAAAAGAGALRLRLRLDAAAELHELRWETLRDPLSGAPLALDERVRLSRALDSPGARPFQLPPRPDLRALVAIAAPPGLERFGLAAIDMGAELARARAALGEIPAVVLGDAPGRPASLEAIGAALRDGPQILYLVCHGVEMGGAHYLWLEDGQGQALPVPAAEFCAAMERLSARPLLALLVACGGAGGYGPALRALGPLLAAAGLPAVLAFQGEVSYTTAAALLPALLSELRRDGLADRALSAARQALGPAGDWWQAVLWLRSRDGRIWREAPAEAGRPEREGRLRALIHDHRGDVDGRVERFVGRAAELAAVRGLIDELRPAGGYLVVSGQAGQGKSSLIARMVADAEAAAAGPGGPEQVICHFVPLDPGGDHQASLLRSLLARLCLRHGLPDYYAAGASRAELATQLASALRALGERGEPETIYLDGLDQLPAGPDGERDLSFLPERLPAGVVVVVGTRPDDTLQPLALRGPQRRYELPPLSRPDLDLLLARRGLRLERALADRLYAAMQASPLYLDLAARELARAPSSRLEALIARVADNPQSLFSLSIARLRRRREPWRALIKPILGLLLISRRSLRRPALRGLLGVDDEELREGLGRLGGLILLDSRGGYSLYHDKLREYLREDPARPDKEYLFAADEERALHRRMADWCAPEDGAIWDEGAAGEAERERRAYARRHSVGHLAAAGEHRRLWALLDSGAFAAAKLRYDPSTRTLALDLDIARRAVVEAAGGDERRGLALLPRLWRYSLLRVGLASQADRYPLELLLALAELGREREAVALAELRTDAGQRAESFVGLAPALVRRGQAAWGRELLLRAAGLASELSINRRQRLLSDVAEQLAAAGWLRDALAVAEELPNEESAILGARGSVLARLAQIAAVAGEADAVEEALGLIPAAQQDAGRSDFVRGLAGAGQLELARQFAARIVSPGQQALAEYAIAAAEALALAEQGQFEAARQRALAIEIDHLRDRALQDAARAAAWAGDLAGADTLLEAIGGRLEQISVLSALAAVAGDAKREQDAYLMAIGDGMLHEDDRALSRLAIDLALAGRAEAAEQAIQSIPKRGRSWVVIRAARGLIAAGAADAVPTILSLLPGDKPDDTPTELAEVFSDLVGVWREDIARSLLAKHVVDSRWLPIRAAIALACARAGRPAEAERWLAEARGQAADQTGRETGRDLLLQILARALGAAGQVDTALELAYRIGDEQARQATAILALLNAGRPAEAAEIARAIPEPIQQALMLRDLARLHIRLGQLDEAAPLIAAISLDYPRAEAQAELAAAYARAGRIAEAAGVAAAIADERFRAIARAAIAGAYARAGRSDDAEQSFAAARAIADGLPNEGLRAQANAAIAGALAESGRLDKALVVAAQIPPGDHHYLELAWNLIQLLVLAGRPRDARALADSLPHGHPYQRAIRALCAAYAAAGDLGAALEVAGEMGTEEERALRRQAVVLTLVSAGQLDQAGELVRQPPLSLDAPTLASVAQAQARAGRAAEADELFEQAAWAVQTGYDPGQRPAAAAALAEALAEAGRLPRLLRLAQELWLAARTSQELLDLLAVAAPLVVGAAALAPQLLDAHDAAERQLAGAG